MREFLPDVFTWPWFSKSHGYDFNGTLVLHDGGNLCIDPVDPPEAVLDRLVAENDGEVAESLGNAAYILRSVAQSIDSISQDLEGSARNMNEFSRQIRQDPGVLFDMPWRNDAAYPVTVPQ